MFFLFVTNSTFAQSGQKWSTGLNTITTGEALGTLNNQPLQFKVNNALALQINTDGSVRLNFFSNNGNGIVAFDNSGTLIPFVFPYDTTKVLLGNGTWGNIPIPNDYWHLQNNDLYTLTSGNVGIGTNNPQFKLDIDGDVRITENLYVGGGIIITDKVNAASEVNTGKINATLELKSAALRVDSIIMDSTKAIYGQANFDGDVKLANKLRVDGDVQINGNFRTAGSLTFANNKTISYMPSQNGTTGNLCFGTQIPLQMDPCFEPITGSDNSWFAGSINLWGNANWNSSDFVNVLTMGFDGSNGRVELTGKNTDGVAPRLLINYECGKDVFINSGDKGDIQLTGVNGKVGIGVFPTNAKLDVEGDVRISSLTAQGGVNNLVQVNSNGILTPISLDIAGIGLWQKSTTNINDIFTVNTGNVGIGTSTPGAKLEINAGNTSGLIVTTQHGNSWGYNIKSIVDDDYTKAFSVTNGNSENFLVYGNGSAYFNGNVGIGIASPGAKLYVQGGQIKVNEAEVGAGELRVGAAWGYPGIYGESATMPLVLGSATNNIFMNGNVGIGTNAPSSKLTIWDNTSDETQMIRIGAGATADYKIYREQQTGTLIIQGTQDGYNNFSYKDDAGNVLFRILENGNVGVGTANPDAPFTVKGKIKASEIEVVELADIPDYVFEKNYSLMNLSELEIYINENKHLPEIPTAEFVKNNGMKLGEMNTLLLKKVEEQTLYIIYLKKRMDELEKLILSKK